MSRPTLTQLEALVEFLEQNPGIAKGLLRTAHAKQETKRKWDEISLTLNALGGAQKDGKGWAKYWADKKCSLKKTCAQQGQSMRRTGGGTADNLPALTPLDQRLVAVMGGLQFAAGDSHVAISPFPSTSHSQNHEIPFIITLPNDEFEQETSEPIVNTPASTMQTAETERGHSYSPSTRTQTRVRSQRQPIENITASPMHTSETERGHANSPTIQTQTRDRSQRQRVRSRSMLNQDRELFAAIERQRVEAETATARALSDIAHNLSNFNTSLDNMSAAIKEGTQTVANALNNIASNLQKK